MPADSRLQLLEPEMLWLLVIVKILSPTMTVHIEVLKDESACNSRLILMAEELSDDLQARCFIADSTALEPWLEERFKLAAKLLVH